MNLPQTAQPPQTIVDLLRQRGQGNAHQDDGYLFLNADQGIEEQLCYGELDRQAKRIAARLLAAGHGGQRALILCSPGAAYLASFFGCLYAGITAVTAYPPRARRRDERLDGVIEDSQPTLALVDAALCPRQSLLSKATPSIARLAWVDVDSIRFSKPANEWRAPAISPADLAVLQYTSGSTSSPRGVQLTHRNLIHNLGVIRETFAFTSSEKRSVCWLPPYHDMGLIGGLLQPLFSGLSTYVMSPAAFVQKPLRWLQAISDFRANASGGPNFAYDLCVEKISDEQAATLDLSCWTLAFNGAEPIVPETLERFVRKFGRCGFRAESFLTCYGLAESTLMVSGGPRHVAPRTKVFETPLSAGTPRAVTSCGPVSKLQTVRIVDPVTERVCHADEEGEIWITSESVSSGYFRRTEESDQTFSGRLPNDPRSYLRSGDLGRLCDGHLYVTGRLKDLIVLRGRNLHPHELEATIDRCHEQSIVHGSAAFTVARPSDQALALAIVHEVKRGTSEEDCKTIVAAIRRHIAAEFDVQVEAIELIRSGSLPRTSSGKPRRRETRMLFEAGKLATTFAWRDSGMEAAKPIVPPTMPNPSGASSATVRIVSESETQRWLAERIAKQVGCPLESIDIESPFAEFGLDSVSAVMIAGELEEHAGRPLPPTLFYDAPNIAEVARLVVGEETPAALPTVSTDALNIEPQDIDANRVAIVGVACRLPGCDTPAAFWERIRSGKHAITEPPPNRTMAISDAMTTTRAGWLTDIDQFDAALFGITPTEAQWIDPQHRLLLETCWQAVENAGQDPKRLSRQQVGVFVGISNDDYAQAILKSGLAPSAYSVTGNAASMAAHRISYHLNLHGPSLSIDTACSSSLVAVHQARRSLQAGDCDAAIVAGVNLILQPDVSEALSDAGMLAADGLCRSFDAQASGYVRGEGCVAMMLKRVGDAQRDGDPILAVIAGSAVNQDGRTNGITAPNGTAQQRLIAAALRDAQLNAEAVTLIEAHGTGTILGDPIEFQALRDAYDLPSNSEPPAPCVVGSVKAIVGHLEAAAGITSLLKAVLAIRHRELPPLANYSQPNPHLSLVGSRLTLPTQPAPWTTASPVAAVSSFGFGGTNAHVLVAGWAAVEDNASTATDTEPRSQLIALSGHNATTVKQLAAAVAQPVLDSTLQLADIAATATASRTSLPHRVAVIADDRQAMAAGLRAFASDLPTSKSMQTSVYTGVASPKGEPRVGWMFSGQGGQSVGMGRDLYRVSKTFRDWIDQCADQLDPDPASAFRSFLLDQPCRCEKSAQRACEHGQRLCSPASQIALFAIEVGIAKIFQQWGVTPHVVLGHSMGEYAAACVAGVMRPEEGLRLTARRAEAIERLPTTGTMMVVFADLPRIQSLLESTAFEWGHDGNSVSVAAINGPEQIVLSGASCAMHELTNRLSTARLGFRFLPTAHAFHSSMMDPVLDELHQAARSLDLQRPQVPFISTLTGEHAQDALTTADYWTQHTRQPVLFAKALQTLFGEACDLVLEIGPHPILCALTAVNPGPTLPHLPTLERVADDVASLQRAAANLYVAGVDLDWGAAADLLHGLPAPTPTPTTPAPTTRSSASRTPAIAASRRGVLLPNYPFQRRRHWLTGLQTPSAPRATSPPLPAETAAQMPAVPVEADADAEELAQLRNYTSLLPAVDRVIAAFFRDTLLRLGWTGARGESITLSDVAERLQIIPGYHKMLWRMLEVLCEEGDLQSHANGWTVVRPLAESADRGDVLAAQIVAGNPSVALEMRMACRCGAALGDVLTGKVEPLAALIPDGNFDELEALYGRSPMAVRANRIVADQVVAAAKSLRHPLRILEIGAGTGGTTAGVLERLTAEQIEYSYAFTDTSPVFTYLAAEKFTAYPQIEYGVLDIERTPLEQGWLPQAYDLVLAANVLHATASLRQTLHNTQQVVAPGGRLLLLESTGKRRLLDIIFGMTSGWWRFADTELRSHHALLMPEQWETLLRSSGFREPTATAVFTTPDYPSPCQSVIVAFQPTSVATPMGKGSETNSASGLSSPGATAKNPQPVASAVSESPQASRDASSDESPAARLRNAPAEQRSALLERFLAERLATISGLDANELDVEQPVNNLGVDSLMAIQLKNRVESELEIKIPMVAFLQGLSIRQLMQKMLEPFDQTEAMAPATVSVPAMTTSLPTAAAGLTPASNLASSGSPAASSHRVIRCTASEVLPEVRLQVTPATATTLASDGTQLLGPLSIGQQSLWTIHQLAPTNSAYNFAFIARAVPGPDVRGGTVCLDAKRVRRACERLLALHPVLRTCYRLQGNLPQRVILPNSNVQIEEYDCTDWDEAALLTHVRKVADRPFDLHNGPVIRFALMRHEQGDLLSIVMHHIAADLWSMDLLIQQLCKLYMHPQAISEPDDGGSFDSYVQWEQGQEHSDEGERLWQYWQAKLHAAPQVLQLPTSFPRPAQQTYQGDSFNWGLSPEITKSLRSISSREQTTLFTTMLAAYQGYLSRVCGQDDLLVGTVVANRSRSEWEQVVGYFLNQIVLRAQLKPTTTFRDLLTQTRADVLSALEHQGLPFAQLVRRLEAERDPSRAPLVQTMFIWDKPRHLRDDQFCGGDADLASLRLKPLLMEQRGAPFDLSLIVFELDDRLSLAFRYNTDLFSPAAIESLADGFTACLTALVRQPDQAIAEAPLVSRDVYQRQIVTWNKTHVSYQPTTALQLFEQQVTRQGDAPAIVTTTATQSYAELNDHAEQIATKLASAGVVSGNVVGISLPRGAQSIAAILATWKVGAAYLPLDPDYPDARLKYMVDDAQPACIVTHDDDRFAVPAVSPDFDNACDSTRRPAENFAQQTDQPAYMIYTSGSTGQPKGALLRHRGLCNLSLAQAQTFGVQTNDRVLQFASLNFDASIFEIVMALHNGAALCIPDIRGGQPTSAIIIEQMRMLGITIATLPPSILASQAGADLPDLRTVISAGEACTPSCIENWSQGREFYNAYGPTEATVWSTVHRASGELSPPIGRPIANCKAYVLDKNLYPLPVGVPGELCLSGPGLAIGYHGQAALTAEKFVPNPFSDDHDATLYRTGDLVRFRTDGQIEFLGRIDNQVKISGHRIEPDEIAAAIGQIARVRGAIVVPHAIETPNGPSNRLVAYYTPDIMPGPNISEMRSAVRARLPEFMVPSHWVPVPEFPLTANGKIDIAALPAVTDQRPDLLADFLAPTTSTELRLAEIWCEVLQLERVGIRDNFFDLGGASLQAVQAAEQANLAGFELAPEKMFQYQTIEQLAAEIEATRETVDTRELAAVGGVLQAAEVGEPWFPADVSSAVADRPPTSVVPPLSDKPQYPAPPVTAQPAEVPRTASAKASSTAKMVVESLGTYLPTRQMSTSEVVQGCAKPLDFPLERMSGIVSRHVVGENEFSIDLARHAASDCFANSRYQPADIDLLVACNISRYDGPHFRISYEPTTAAKLAQQLGMPHAWTFDICNACAGFFTAMEMVRAMLVRGTVRRAMIVSGEYISHLASTAQREIDGFMDPRLACLTLGDAGAATILEMSNSGAGFEALDLYTAGKHHELCVAKVTQGSLGGAVMLTDAVRASAVTLKHSVGHAHRIMQQFQWDPTQVDKLIMHQTSTTTLDGALEELNRSYGRKVCDRETTVYNVMTRGNTASTTHWLAVMDQIRSGQLHSGDQTVFAISGSGQTVGTALYRFDDLPERLLAPVTKGDATPARPGQALGFAKPTVELIAAAVAQPQTNANVVAMAADAAEQTLDSAAWDRRDLGLLIHAGVYRNEYLSEPAVAAILAGEMKINEDLPEQDGRRTLAFDLLDGGRGALTACLVAAHMMEAGHIEKTLITSSEVENNAEFNVSGRRGIAEMGSALLLQRSRRGVGLGATRMQRFDQYQDLIETHTSFEAGRTLLKIQQAADAESRLVQCVAETVTAFLREQSLTPQQITTVLPPRVSSGFATALADAIGIERSRFVVPEASSIDLFTSTLAVQWQQLRRAGLPTAGSLGLLIGVGAGVEVGCTLYHF